MSYKREIIWRTNMNKKDYNSKKIKNELELLFERKLNAFIKTLDAFLEARFKEEMDEIDRKLSIKESIKYHQDNIDKLFLELHNKD